MLVHANQQLVAKLVLLQRMTKLALERQRRPPTRLADLRMKRLDYRRRFRPRHNHVQTFPQEEKDR
jgi:hypothetical protein